MTGSQWADQYRVLSRGPSSEYGRWKTTRAEYLREVMDVLSSRNVDEVVFMGPHQSGKTEVMLNDIGRTIDVDPCSILVVRPTDTMGQEFSKRRFMPMMTDTPCLASKIEYVKRGGTRTGPENTINEKSFPGGSMSICGANSPSPLASRAICRVHIDEVDRMEPNVEGDPVEQAMNRNETFYGKDPNAIIFKNSTPKNKGTSKIEAAYLESDQRKFYVPCLKCEASQLLLWSQVEWPKGKPMEAHYKCVHCEYKLNDIDIDRMVKRGHWEAGKPFERIVGFWINAIYSPWVSLSKMAKKWIQAQGHPQKLRVFVNTMLAETWEEIGGEKIDEGELYNRRENYSVIPMGGLVVTAGVDVQKDRLEIEVVAHGLGFESWGIEYRVLYGNTLCPEVWQDLGRMLETQYDHASGLKFTIVAACVDTGYRPAEVSRFLKNKFNRRIFGTKGMSQPGKPIVGKPTKSNLEKINLFPVGTDTAKAQIYGRLDLDEIGNGYMHFPMSYNMDYFKGLTIEKLVTKYKKGVILHEFVCPSGGRNEPLDVRVLNNVALEIVSPNFESIALDIHDRAEAVSHNIKPLQSVRPRRRFRSKGVVL